jgi:hypothetical protein
VSEQASWAILRQVVIATTAHDADLDSVRAAFGLGQGFEDPELEKLHMVDATLPVSKETYLEFIAPLSDEAGVSKWLNKIGGRGGYVLSVQHPDPAAVKARALARGIRVPVDVEAFGHPVVQLHPQDVGLLLEVDGITDSAVWFWDDVNPGPESDAGISDIIGVEVPVADPQAITTLWHELLDLGAPVKDNEVQMGGTWVRFVPGGPSADWNIVLRRAETDAGKAVTAPTLSGIRFELV